MGTNVTYNGVLLQNVTTRQWEQEVTYDDSGTDVIRQVFHLRFDAIMHLAETSDGPKVTTDGDQGGSISQSYTNVSRRLGQARGELEITMNGESVLRVLPAAVVGSQIDTDNGPHPRHVSITHVAGNKLFRVQFAVDAATGSCPYGSHILSNRWSVSESMDENWFTTRTIRGRMRLADTTEFPAQNYRYVVVPPLELGFRRQSVEYVVAQNGLDVDYVVVDRQTHDAAPWPATKITGTFGESTADGIQYFSDLHLRLDGPPNADKKMMLTRAVQIAQQKMEIIVPNANENKQAIGYLPVNMALVEHIGDSNAVEIHFTIKHMKEPGEYLTNLWVKWLGNPLDLPSVVGEPKQYDPKESRSPSYFGYTPHTPGDRDTALLLVLRCYLQTPCGTHQIGVADPERMQGNPGSQTDVMGVQYPGQMSTSPGDNYSDDTHFSMYTHCAAETTYRMIGGKVQLPVAGDGTTYQPGQGNVPNTSAIIGLSQPVAHREIKVDFERAGQWPSIPMAMDSYSDGQDGSLRATLLKHWVRPQPPTLSVDGRSPIYRVSAYYLYALNRPPTGTDQAIGVGVLPFTDYTREETAFIPAEVYNNRIGP